MITAKTNERLVTHFYGDGYDPPHTKYPDGEEGVTALGTRHFVRGGPNWWMWWHDCPQQDHIAWEWFGDKGESGRSGHRIVNRNPLTVEGSLVCIRCGDHGFIRDGVWVPA